jgi:hypothetical protein
MTTRNRPYPQATLPFFTHMFVVPQTAAISTDATFTLFCTNAVDGEIAVFNNITKARIAGAIPVGTEYFIAQRRGTTPEGSPIIKITPPIISNNPKKYKPCPFIANVKQAIEIVVTAPATEKDQTFDVIVKDVTPQNEPYNFFTLSFVSLTGVETVAQIRDGLLASYTGLLNNTVFGHPYETAKYFTVTASGAAGLLITALYDETNFTVQTRNDLYGGATVNTNGAGNSDAWVAGSGLGWKVQSDEELSHLSADGNTFVNTERFERAAQVQRFGKAECTYDYIQIDDFNREILSGGAHERYNRERMNILIAVETTTPDTTGSATFTALSAAFV